MMARSDQFLKLMTLDKEQLDKLWQELLLEDEKLLKNKKSKSSFGGRIHSIVKSSLKQASINSTTTVKKALKSSLNQANKPTGQHR